MKNLVRIAAIAPTLFLLAFCSRGGNEGSFFSGAFGGGGGGAGGGSTSLPVVAEDIKRDTISAFIVTTSTLNAYNQIDVLSQSSGRVVQIFAEEGDEVEQGSLLAALDQSSAQLDLVEAQAHYDNTKRIFERIENLFKANDVSSDEYASQEYQLELRSIQREEARIKLANTEIRSPIEGVVTARNIAVGTSVSNNQRTFSIADFDPMIAIIHVPEREIESIKAGQSAMILPDAVDEDFEGVVSLISPVVNPSSGTVKVTIEVRDESARLKPGMFVAVKVPTETRPNVLVIPKKSVVVERDQNIVYVMDSGVARRVQVDLGLAFEEVVEVRGGLNDGDKVITVGQEAVRDQQPVRIAGEPVPETAPQTTGEGTGSTAGAAGAAAGGATAQRSAGGQQAGGGRPGGGGGGFDLSQMSDEQREGFEQRILNNPQVKEAYDAALKEDPDLAKDKEKRLKFFTEQMEKLRESGGFGGGGRR